MSSLDEFHQQKDVFFKTDEHSPLTPEQQQGFTALTYFPENNSLRFRVQAEVFETQEEETIQLSTGDSVEYVRWARASFLVGDEPVELLLYRDSEDEELIFLPFKDATAAAGETYGGGRYLDVHETDDGSLYIDFNYAYNPYCAYNEAWSCPLPPVENQLSIRIEAGERSFAD